MTSGSLSSRGNRGAIPTFAQQGQVDWVAFGNTAWSLTSAILQRFSAAEVQPATYGAGLALGCQFELGALGSRRIEDQLRRLRGFESCQKLVWFGFGYKHFVHLLSESQAGFNCLALCACLVDTHTSDVAADILSKLWTVYGFPMEYQPSHVQFVNLVKACEGVLAQSPFGHIVEQMTDLGRYSSKMLYDTTMSPRNWGKCAESEGIASVLRALFDISKGKMETITVTGGLECAFIGGMAKWLFDLHVYIKGLDAPYQNQTPHVIIQYDSPTNAAGNHSQGPIAKLKNTLDSGLILRVPWESCLSKSFGNYFEEICSISYALGEFLGSACRIYSAFSLGEEDLGLFESFREGSTEILDTCYGSGLVSAITSIFPELHNVENLARTMQLQEVKPFSEATKAFQRSYHSIKERCTCITCGRSSATSRGPGQFCILLIAYTILHIARILGAVERDPDILPTISGIRRIYYDAPKDQGKDHYKTLKNNRSYIHDLLGLDKTSGAGLISDPITLFSGSTPRQEKGPIGISHSSSHMTAISWRGFCCYNTGLRRLSSQPEVVRILGLLPGHIQWGRRSYNAVYDYPAASDVRNQISRLHDMNILDPDVALQQSRSELRAVLKEQPGAHALYFAYTISLNPGRPYQNGPLPALYILPGMVSDTVLRRSCLIPCTNSYNCPKDVFIKPQPCLTRRIPLNSDQPSHLTDDSTGGLHFDEGGLACTVSRPGEDDLDTCIAIQLYTLANPQASQILIRRHECLPCSTRAILRYSPDIMKGIRVRESYPERKVVFHILNTQSTTDCSGAVRSSDPAPLLSE